jgi:hypothetical protein
MITQGKPGRRHGERGTAAVEFALVAPMMVALMMGILEFGRWSMFAILAQAAAYSGADYGSLNLMTAGDSAGIKTYTEEAMEYMPAGYTVTNNLLCVVNGVQPPAACASYNGLGGPPARTYYIQVTVTEAIPLLMSFPGIPSAVTVNGMAERQVAEQ